MDTPRIRPPSWSAIRRGARSFDVVGDAKTADGWTAAALRWLLRAFAFGAVCLAARVCVSATPLAESDFAIALYGSLLALFLIYVPLSPAVYGMIFRLRARLGLRSALVSIAVYAPIFGLAANASLIALSSLAPFADGGEGASAVSFGDWTTLALVMGVVASALTALAYRTGKAAPAPPPAITARRFYAPIEITAAIAALVCVMSVPILAA